MTKTTTTAGELEFAARAAGDQLCWAVGCREWNAGAIVLLPPGGGMVSIPLCAAHKAQAQRELDARGDGDGPDDDGGGSGGGMTPERRAALVGNESRIVDTRWPAGFPEQSLAERREFNREVRRAKYAREYRS